MKTNIPFERINRSRLLMFGSLLCMFLIMFFCNIKTPLLVDDYAYLFSFADGRRIESIKDIFQSLVAHRYIQNGRLVAHFFVHLFLMLPHWIFKIINSIIFVSEVYLIYHIANRDQERRNLLLCAIFSCIWIFTLNFGQVALWLSGSINYLWATFFSLSFLSVYITKFMDGRDIKPLPLRLLFVLAGFLVGAYSENCSSTVIFAGVCFMLLSRFIKKQKVSPYLWLAILAAFCGFLFMMSAPAEIANKSSQFTLSNLFDNFITALEMYRRIWLLLAVYAALAAAAYFCRIDMESQILAFMLMLSSLASVFVLTFASFFPERSAYIGTLLIIAADAVLFAALFQSRLNALMVSLGLICLMASFYRGAVGVQDIIKTNYFLTENENHIIACREDGIMDVEVYRVYSKTGYCAIEGLGYLNTEVADSWPNKYMAAYFGVDSIIGS